MNKKQHIPSNWFIDAHKLWMLGRNHEAIKTLIDEINAIKSPIKPKGYITQFVYYLFLQKDYLGAETILKESLKFHPNDLDFLTNLITILNRCHKYSEVISYSKILIKQNSKAYNIYDSLAHAYSKLQKLDEAKHAGERALKLKDALPKKKLSKPLTKVKLDKNKSNVIAFSLWGKNKRYLYGALRNILLSHDLYPNWKFRYYVDKTIPLSFRELLQELGAEVYLQTNNQSIKEKLSWRFKVANDTSVGYFLVRDVDSVINLREVNAVNEWLASEKTFHIMRDWWTHTDLILAGMWGGIAGVLPNINELLKSYTPNSMETPNIDQWFLRDIIWPLIKDDVLIHDRCYEFQNSLPIPGKNPKGNIHIGSCEYTQNKKLQEKLLSPWINNPKYPYLK